MRSEDLSALLRIRRGDVHSVCSRVLAQNKASLDADEDAFLREHTAKLDAVQLARWLAFRPERSAAIVRALCEKFSSDSDVLLWHVLRWKSAIDQDAWAEITQSLAPRLSRDSSRALAYGLRGAPPFDAIVRAEQSLVPVERAANAPAALALALAEVRYDPAGCERVATEHARRLDDDGAYARAVLVHAERSQWIPAALRERATHEHDERCQYAQRQSLAKREAGPTDALDASALLDDGELDELLSPLAAAPETAREDARFDRERIDWLAEHGAKRRDLVAIALDRLASGALIEHDTRAVIHWLAEQLQTRSAWEQHGALILDRLLTVWRWDPIGRIVAFLDDVAAESDRSAGEQHPQLLLRTTPPPWTAALHEALAKVILDRVGASLDHDERPRAHALLEALVQLELPPRCFGALRALGQRASRDERSRELLALHGQLCRRASPEVATVDGAIAALRDLAVLEAL